MSWLPFSGSSPIESSRTSGLAMPRISSAKIGAHVGELEQVLGARVRVRAAVEQHRRARFARGSAPRSPAASTPCDAADLEQPGGEHRAGVAGRDDSVGLAFGRPRGTRRRASCPASRARPRRASRPSRSPASATTSSSPPVSRPAGPRGSARCLVGRRERHRRRPLPGPRSPPMASTAIRIRRLREVRERLDVAALVRPAVRADALRALRLADRSGTRSRSRASIPMRRAACRGGTWRSFSSGLPSGRGQERSRAGSPDRVRR